MSENTLRPIWTPDDARQTARDAAQHPTFRGDGQPADRIPVAGSRDMRPRRARRLTKAILVAVVLVLVLTVGALWASTRADADPEPSGLHCVDQFWLIPFQSTRRTICDGPIQADGSWTRLREFYTPAHHKPLRTTCSGRYSVTCTTTGGYFVERTSSGIESYPVTPATILPDEPGHIGASA